MDSKVLLEIVNFKLDSNQSMFNSLYLSVFLLIIQELGVKTSGETCYTKELFPKMFSNADLSTETYVYSVTASDTLKQVFQGGKSQLDGGTAWIMAVDLNSNRVQWQRYFRASNPLMDSITAMSPSSDNQSLAVVGSHGLSYHIQWFFTVRPGDGGHQTNVIEYVLGESNLAEHSVRDSGLFYAINGVVYMALKQVSPVQRDAADGSFTDYAGRMLIGAFNPKTTSFKWLKEATDYFGYSAALVHKNYCRFCANIFVAGANDISHQTASDAKQWVISIMTLTETGDQEMSTEWPYAFHIVQKEWEQDPAYAPVVDHMYLDDPEGVEYLFGSTRAFTEGSYDSSGGYGRVYLWIVKLDLYHYPDKDQLTCVKLQNNGLGMKNQDQIVSLKPNLVNGKLHGLIQDRDKAIYYFTYDWQVKDGLQAVWIKSTQDGQSFAAFSGAKSWYNSVGPGNFIYEAYIGTNADYIIYYDGSPISNPDTPFSGQINDFATSAILSSTQLSDDTCLPDFSDVSSYQQFYDFKATNAYMLIRKSDLQIMQPISFAGSSVTVGVLNIWDESNANMFDTYSFCSSPPTITAVTAGSAPDPLCTAWNDSYNSIDFTPNTASGSASECSDSQPTWIYDIDQTGLLGLEDFFKVSIDSSTNKIWVKGMPGPTDEDTYTVTVVGHLPGTTQTASFAFIVNMSPCLDYSLTPPVIDEQVYYFTDPEQSYEAGVFTQGTGCNQPITYTNTVITVNTFINNFSGEGKKLAWQTDNLSDLGLYTIQIEAETICTAKTIVRYDLRVEHYCKVQEYQIDPGQAKFIDPAVGPSVTTMIMRAQTDFSWSESDLSRPRPEVDCGPVVFQVVMKDGSDIDIDVFSFDNESAPLTLQIYTEDALKFGTFEFTILMTTPDYPENPGASTDFSIVIEEDDRCFKDNIIIDPGLPLPTQNQFIEEGAITTQSFSEFVTEPAYCQLMYAMVVTPQLQAPDDQTITYDAASRSFTVSTSNISLLGDYQVLVTAITPAKESVDTGIGWSFSVSIRSRCAEATITFDPIILPDPLSYVASFPADVQTIDEAKVTVADDIALLCPFGFEYVLGTQDDSTIDAELFSFDSSTMTLNTVATVPEKVGEYALAFYAHFAGFPILPTNKFDFTVIVIDPCIDHAVITATPQTDPAGYWYTGSDPAATFTMNPFTIAPEGFCTPKHTCKVISGPRADLCNVKTAHSQGNFSSATGNYEFYSTLILDVVPGDYIFEVKATLGSQSAAVQFNLKLHNPCEDPDKLTVQATAQNELEPYYYTGLENKISFKMNPFIVVPSVCGITYTCRLHPTSPIQVNICSVNAAETMAKFSSTTGDYEFYSTDIARYPAGVYELIIEGTSFSKQDQVMLRIELIDPCPTTSLSFGDMELENQIYNLRSEPMVFAHGRAKIEDKALSESGICGYIGYYATLNRKEIGRVSRPISYNAVRQTFEIFSDEVSFIGQHLIEIVSFMENYPQITTKASFQVLVLSSLDMLTVVYEPEWLTLLENQQIRVGEDLEYVFGEWDDDLYAEVFVNRNSQIRNMTYYNATTHTFVVEGHLVTPQKIGVWEINVVVKYKARVLALGDAQRDQTYHKLFYLIVEDKILMDDASEDGFSGANGSSLGLDGRYAHLPADFQGQIILEKQEENQSRPVPYIVNFSVDGVLEIGWNQQMQELSTILLMNEHLVAANVRLTTELREYAAAQLQSATKGRSLRKLNQGVRKNEIYSLEGDESMRLIILSAIDIKFEREILDSDDEQGASNFSKELQWTLKKYSSNFLTIQIDLDDLALPQIPGAKDEIVVRFFGVQFFQNTLGVEVEFANELRQPYLKSISSGHKDVISKISTFIEIATLLVLFVSLLLVGIYGGLLPTWVFINSLTLVAHTPMFNSGMPANLHYFLTRHLDLFRLNIPSLNKQFELMNREFSALASLSTQQPELALCGYHADFFQNLALVIILQCVLITIVGVLTLFPDLTQKRLGQRRYAAFAANFSIRFFYEFVFEICLCIMIQFQAAAWASQSGLSWVLAVGHLLLVIGLVAFLVTRFFWGALSLKALTPSDGDVAQDHNQKFRPPSQSTLSYGEGETKTEFYTKNAAAQDKQSNVPSSDRQELKEEMKEQQQIKTFEGGSLDPSAEADQQDEKEALIENEAKKRVQNDDLVTVDRAYATLFFGLRKNHPHQMAIVHPIIYILRRFLLATIFVFMRGDSIGYFGCLLLLACSMAILFTVAHERQFTERLINWQFFANEAVLYIFCLSLMMFSGVITDSAQVEVLGFTLIGLAILFGLFNLAVIMYESSYFLRLYLRSHIKPKKQSKADLKRKANVSSVIPQRQSFDGEDDDQSMQSDFENQGRRRSAKNKLDSIEQSQNIDELIGQDILDGQDIELKTQRQADERVSLLRSGDKRLMKEFELELQGEEEKKPGEGGKDPEKNSAAEVQEEDCQIDRNSLPALVQNGPQRAFSAASLIEIDAGFDAEEHENPQRTCDRYRDGDSNKSADDRGLDETIVQQGFPELKQTLGRMVDEERQSQEDEADLNDESQQFEGRFDKSVDLSHEIKVDISDPSPLVDSQERKGEQEEQKEKDDGENSSSSERSQHVKEIQIEKSIDMEESQNPNFDNSQMDEMAQTMALPSKIRNSLNNTIMYDQKVEEVIFSQQEGSSVNNSVQCNDADGDQNEVKSKYSKSKKSVQSKRSIFAPVQQEDQEQEDEQDRGSQKTMSGYICEDANEQAYEQMNDEIRSPQHAKSVKSGSLRDRSERKSNTVEVIDAEVSDGDELPKSGQNQIQSEQISEMSQAELDATVILNDREFDISKKINQTTPQSPKLDASDLKDDIVQESHYSSDFNEQPQASQDAFQMTTMSDKSRNAVNHDDELTFYNIPGLEYGDPLRQMFDFHKLPYKNKSVLANCFSESGQRANMFEMPYIFTKGQDHKLNTFRDLLQTFCKKYKFFDTGDEEQNEFTEKVVDSYTQILQKQNELQIRRGLDKQNEKQAFISACKALQELAERNFEKHGSKFATGGEIKMADFILASYISNQLLNPACPVSIAAKIHLQQTPKFKAYVYQVMCDKFPIPIFSQDEQTSNSAHSIIPDLEEELQGEFQNDNILVMDAGDDRTSRELSDTKDDDDDLDNSKEMQHIIPPTMTSPKHKVAMPFTSSPGHNDSPSDKEPQMLIMANFNPQQEDSNDAGRQQHDDLDSMIDKEEFKAINKLETQARNTFNYYNREKSSANNIKPQDGKDQKAETERNLIVSKPKKLKGGPKFVKQNYQASQASQQSSRGDDPTNYAQASTARGFYKSSGFDTPEKSRNLQTSIKQSKKPSPTGRKAAKNTSELPFVSPRGGAMPRRFLDSQASMRGGKAERRNNEMQQRAASVAQGQERLPQIALKSQASNDTESVFDQTNAIQDHKKKVEAKPKILSKGGKQQAAKKFVSGAGAGDAAFRKTMSNMRQSSSSSMFPSVNQK